MTTTCTLDKFTTYPVREVVKAGDRFIVRLAEKVDACPEGALNNDTTEVYEGLVEKPTLSWSEAKGRPVVLVPRGYQINEVTEASELALTPAKVADPPEGGGITYWIIAPVAIVGIGLVLRGLVVKYLVSRRDDPLGGGAASESARVAPGTAAVAGMVGGLAMGALASAAFDDDGQAPPTADPDDGAPDSGGSYSSDASASFGDD